MEHREASEWSRRRFMLTGAVLSGTALGGCCTVPPQRIAGLCEPDPAPFLAGPEVLAAWARPERFFDAHAHFFNAADVPVEQFLAKSVAHSIEDETIRHLVIALAPVAAALAHLAESPQIEMAGLCGQSSARVSSSSASSDRLDTAIERRRLDVADALHQEILRRAPTIPPLVNEVARRTMLRQPESQLLKSPGATGFSRDFVREALVGGAGFRSSVTNQIQPYVFDQLRIEDVQLAQVRSALQFVGFMLSPRHHNLRTYIQRFAHGSPNTPLSGVFGAMVDFNYWLDCPNKASNMRDQVLVHEQMALLSRGFLLPIVAYNPWVDIAEQGASLATVKWAVQEHGCVGVKIYPPMGFYPYGNDGHPIEESDQKRPDPKELDARLAELYTTCDALGVPVMAHANESNGRDTPSDKLAGPVGWRRAATDLPNLHQLYVNAGHFGGALVHGSDDWTTQFANLMQRAGKLKLYGDLGYWDELIVSEPARARLRAVLAMPAGDSSETVAARTMYGSDWLMLAKTPGWETYADGIANVLRGYDASGSIAQRVLGENVLECYGLNPASGRANLARLQAQYSTPGRRGPGWMAPAP